jgi:membrane protein YqaA with SNARE-associated domain
VSPADLVVRLGVPLATFVTCFVSGIFPLVNAEVFLLAVALVAPGPPAWLVVLVAATGQLVAKSLLYLGGAGVIRVPGGKRRRDIEALRARVERWRSKDLLVFVSAATGLPPFFLLSILAGSMRLPFGRFVAAGFVGRVVRFGALVAIPQVGRWVLEGAR